MDRAIVFLILAITFTALTSFGQIISDPLDPSPEVIIAFK
jgi:hypothetical protein